MRYESADISQSWVRHHCAMQKGGRGAERRFSCGCAEPRGASPPWSKAMRTCCSNKMVQNDLKMLNPRISWEGKCFLPDRCHQVSISPAGARRYLLPENSSSGTLQCHGTRHGALPSPTSGGQVPRERLPHRHRGWPGATGSPPAAQDNRSPLYRNRALASLRQLCLRLCLIPWLALRSRSRRLVGRDLPALARHLLVSLFSPMGGSTPRSITPWDTSTRSEYVPPSPSALSCASPPVVAPTRRPVRLPRVDSRGPLQDGGWP